MKLIRHVYADGTIEYGAYLDSHCDPEKDTALFCCTVNSGQTESDCEQRCQEWIASLPKFSHSADAERVIIAEDDGA